MDEIDLPLWKKPGNHGRRKAALCPACHNTIVKRHCQSPTCDWFVCSNHVAVVGIIGPKHTFWLAKPQQG